MIHKTFLKMIIRLTKLFYFILVLILMVTPFAVLCLIFGLDKANVTMSTIMRHPMNMLFGDDIGDALLQKHQDIVTGIL